MKLSDYCKRYEGYTGIASNCARKLAFAGIALVWIFKIEAQPVPEIPEELIFPLILLAVTLGLDLLQYITASFVWWVFYRYKERQLYNEKKLNEPACDPEFDAPGWLPWPQDIFFTLKLCAVVLAYILIVLYVWGVWETKTTPSCDKQLPAAKQGVKEPDCSRSYTCDLGPCGIPW